MAFQINKFGYVGPNNATTGEAGIVELATITETTAGLRTDIARHQQASLP
jgi:hypothetical protein